MKKLNLLIIASTLSLLVGCGSGGGGSTGTDGDVRSESVMSEGSGILTFVGHFSSERRQSLKLENGSTDGSVYCELTPKGWGIISLGTFSQASFGRNVSNPLSGLTVTIPDIRSSKLKSSDQAFLNVGNTSVSSPSCTYIPEETGGVAIKGTIQCTDSIDRKGWGRTTVTARFSCGQ
jgi:hypothetical protein